MNLNFTKEQYKAIRYVLHEMTMGNLGYRLRPSDDDNSGYDDMAMIINLSIDKMEKHYKDTYTKSMEHSLVQQMEFRIRKGSHSIENVNYTTLEILNKEPGELQGQVFGELLIEEFYPDWQIIKDSMLYKLQTSFCSGLSFYISPLVFCPAYCVFSNDPESDFIQVNAPKVLIRGPIPDYVDDDLQEETIAKFPEEKYIHDLLDNLDKDQ